MIIFMKTKNKTKNRERTNKKDKQKKKTKPKILTFHYAQILYAHVTLSNDLIAQSTSSSFVRIFWFVLSAETSF